MHRKLLNAIVVVCSVLVLFSMLPLRGEAAIYDTVVRLHVIANSDSEEDQARKLRVRDAVLAVTAPLLEDCRSQEEAEALLRANFDGIREAAETVILEDGRSDAIAVSLTTEEYPTRSYDSVCFPSGEYLSLRVCIGEAVGQNWWCCLFPPLCLGAASVTAEEAEGAFVSVGLTPSQYKVVTQTDTPVYRARFKLLELWSARR